MTTPDEDSSTTEAVLGIALQVAVLALVLRTLLESPGWFRFVAAFAALVLLGNLVRLVVLRLRHHRRTAASASRRSP